MEFLKPKIIVKENEEGNYILKKKIKQKQCTPTQHSSTQNLN